MVAISLYRGNLHKVPDVPRQWPVPTPKISLKSFKILLRRRARALSRLRQSSDTPSTSNPNPNPNPNPSNSNNPGPSRGVNAVNRNRNDNDGGNKRDRNDNRCFIPRLAFKEDKKGEVRGVKLVEGGDSSRKLVDKTGAALVEKEKMKKKNVESVKHGEKTEAVVAVNPVPEKSNREDATSEVEKRRKEVKEELEILKERKHNLVQALKQILNAEEQLKRQNSTQGTSSRPPLPLQVDTTTDSGSMTKVLTPRIGSDGNPGGDVDGGEADDVSNHIMGFRQLPRMSSTSPSSDAQHRKPSSNMLPHSYRNTLGPLSSPSRFAPPGQGLSVSASGTSYIASSPSPSPAASGGTSVFRDARLPSPWN